MDLSGLLPSTSPSTLKKIVPRKSMTGKPGDSLSSKVKAAASAPTTAAKGKGEGTFYDEEGVVFVDRNGVVTDLKGASSISSRQ
jgi:hypothetical protein